MTRRSSTWVLCAVAIATLGCGPRAGDEREPCEQDAEIELLTLGTNELSGYSTHRIDGGWLLDVRSYDREIADVYEELPEGRSPGPKQIRMVTVDDCGENVRTIADGINYVEPPPRPDLPWVGVALESPAWFFLDPVEAWAPQPILGGFSPFAWVDGGILVVEGGDLTLVRPTAEGAPTRELLLPNILHFSWPVGHETLRTWVLAIDYYNDLILLDMATRSVQTVRSDVGQAYHLDSDATLIFWETTQDSGRTPYLLDRGRDVEIRLGREDWIGSALGHARAYWMHRGPGSEPTETHLVLLPEMRELWLEGEWTTDTQAIAADGTRVLQGPDGFYRLPPDSDTPVFLRAGSGYARIVGDMIYLWDYGSFVVDERLDLPDPYRVLRMSLDGSSVEDLFGHEVSSSIPLTDDRWAFIGEVDDRGVGDLVVLDVGRSERRIIAEEVRADLDVWNRIPSTDLYAMQTITEAPSDFLYMTWGQDGDHNVMWRVRPDLFDD